MDLNLYLTFYVNFIGLNRLHFLINVHIYATVSLLMNISTIAETDYKVSQY